AAAEIGADIWEGANRTNALFPITAGVPADDPGVWMSFGKGNKIHRRRFAGQVASDFDPGVLEDDGFELGRALDEWIEIRVVCICGHPEFDADHRAIGDAAVDFVEAFARVLGIDVDESEGMVRMFFDRGEDFVILLAEVSG